MNQLHFIRVHIYIISVCTVGHSPRVQSVVGSNPTQGSYIFVGKKFSVFLGVVVLLYLYLVNDTRTMNYIILVFTHETLTSTLV